MFDLEERSDSNRIGSGLVLPVVYDQTITGSPVLMGKGRNSSVYWSS